MGSESQVAPCRAHQAPPCHALPYQEFPATPYHALHRPCRELLVLPYTSAPPAAAGAAEPAFRRWTGTIPVCGSRFGRGTVAVFTAPSLPLGGRSRPNYPLRDQRQLKLPPNLKTKSGKEPRNTLIMKIDGLLS